MTEKILILDFGGQYSRLIARRIRECGVFSEILAYNTPIEKIKAGGYKGLVLSGGPQSVCAENSPKADKTIYSLGVPILGICYGAQLMAQDLGGKVVQSSVCEYGSTNVFADKKSLIFKNTNSTASWWMSHTDYIKDVPEGFKITAHTDSCPVAAMEYVDKALYAIQFHPEVTNSPEGTHLIKSFLFDVCGFSGDWQTTSVTEHAIMDIRNKIGNGKALCALSGGVDSSVAAILVQKAIGKNLTCIFVDHGLLRKDEGDQVEKVFSKFDLNFVRVDASKRFLKKLKNVTDPEEKRKIIGTEFIRVFEEQAAKIGEVDFLVQGTIYPDVIESGLGASALIKSHHNVGGLPKNINFKGLIEPLRELFKDEVRAVGLELGLPENLVFRQPFPGPGLAVRIIGAVTADKVKLLQEADAIFRQEVVSAGLHGEISQYFAVLTDMRSVGVMGDARTYFYTIALRAVVTSDFMTAEWARIPQEVLAKISNRIVNEVHGVNRIVYDITTKPPATVEWE